MSESRGIGSGAGATSRSRLSSGIPGLDEVLSGGLLEGGIYLIAGGPGTGKTVLANQVAYAQAALGRDVLYVTALTESHGRMVENLESLAFFDRSLLGRRMWYLSVAHELRGEGFEPLAKTVEHELDRRQASLVVLDGLSFGAPTEDASHADLRGFLTRLSKALELRRCTAILCMFTSTGEVAAEHAMADGMIDLAYRPVGMRVVRELLVRKYRGSPVLEGRHAFDIDRRGIVVHPRVEAKVARDNRVATGAGARHRFGIEGLDEMLDGGVPGGSATAVVGTSGIGKTLLAMSFLAEGAREGNRGLYFGFREGPERVVENAEAIGLPVARARREGAIDIVWNRRFSGLPDDLGGALLEHVVRRGIDQVVIDNIGGMSAGDVDPVRSEHLRSALVTELGALGVTTVFVRESGVVALEAAAAEPGLEIADNAILLRYAELKSKLWRFISILKVRGSDFDPSIRTFQIGGEGFTVANRVESAEAILSGMPRLAPWASEPDPGHGPGGGQQ